MFKQIIGGFFLALFIVLPAQAVDWGMGAYDTWEPGYYDDTTSSLYDVNDDWYYDSYTMGAQEEEADLGYDDGIGDSFEWESDDELFDSEI